MDNVYLVGSENVQRAATQMQDAASTIQRAATNLDYTMTNFLQCFSQEIDRLLAGTKENK